MTGTGHGDGVGELLQLGVAEVAELLHLGPLQRNIGGQRGDAIQLSIDFAGGSVVGLQVMQVTGIEVSSLTSFSIHEQRFQPLGFQQHLLAVFNQGVVPIYALKRQERDVPVDG